VTVTIHDELEQGTPEWLEARCGLLTASVIGKLITPSTLKPADNDTSRTVTMTLAAERVTRHVEYVHPTYDMQRGTDDEPFARAVYAEHYAPVQEVGFIVREEADYKLGFSPDGLVGDDGLIEIKSRKPNVQMRTFLDDRVPGYNVAQVQAGLFVTERKWLDYVSFSAGMPLYVKRVYPDDRWFAAIEATARKFEVDVEVIASRYAAASGRFPLTERRPDINEISFAGGL
jgi:hypothetical protein